MMAKSTAGWSANSNPMLDMFSGMMGIPSIGGGMPQWMGGVQGAGGASANNVFGTPLGQAMLADIMNASLASAQYEPSQTTTDMMAAGRPSFNWGLMGAVAPLAGALPQPEYTTPPPEFSPKYWREYDADASNSNG